MKKVLIFLLGAFCCFIVLCIIGYYPPKDKLVNPINNIEDKPLQENSNIEYSNYTEENIEHRIKISSPIFINGEEKSISSFELDGIIYVSISELSESLHNLKVHLPNEESNEKGLVIYENSGLSIVNRGNEKYFEVSNLVNRYNVKPGIGLPYVYQSVGRIFLDCKNGNVGVTKELQTAYFVNGISSESLFIKNEDFKNEKNQYLKILFENEIEINRNPDLNKLIQ